MNYKAPPTPAPPGGPGGFWHIQPVQVREDLIVTQMLSASLPWGSFMLTGLAGHVPGDPARTPAILLNYEWPLTWVRTATPLSKTDVEYLHAQRFRMDHFMATGRHAFRNLRVGDNPPDFLADTERGIVGVECTRLALQERLWAHGLFREVRRRIESVPPERFAALSGHMVYMWFNQANSVSSRPFPPSDEDAAVELVEALAEYKPDPAPLWRAAGTPAPPKAPIVPERTTSAGATFYSVPFVGSAPDTPLFQSAGFELGLAYSTQHDAATEWDRLHQRISDKDRAGNDWLLISVGAPDPHGMTYPSEDALADMLLLHLRPMQAPSHLKRVTVHRWSTGFALDLWPEVRPLFGPLYAGPAPALMPKPAPAAAAIQTRPNRRERRRHRPR